MRRRRFCATSCLSSTSGTDDGRRDASERSLWQPRCMSMNVGVVGLGYVGLPLVVAFAEAGDHVVAVDVDERKVAGIEAGRSYIEDVSSERLQAVLGSVEASTHFAPLARTDAVLICVPTPLTPNREPDLGALVSAGKALGQVIQRGQLVVLES